MINFYKFIALAATFLQHDKLDEAGDMYIAAGRELHREARQRKAAKAARHAECRKPSSPDIAHAGITPSIRRIFQPERLFDVSDLDSPADAVRAGRRDR